MSDAKPASDCASEDRKFGAGKPKPAPAPLQQSARIDFSTYSPGYLCAPMDRLRTWLLDQERANRANGGESRAQCLNEGISVIEEILKRTRAKLARERQP